MHFKMVSYADNFEDVVIRRAFPDLNDGFYIDVGAYDPVEHSVTQHFYEGGWRGINVEPNPAPFAKIQATRDRDINLNIGLSDHEGHLTLYAAPGACWSVDRNLITGYFGASADQVEAKDIPVLTLAQLCDRYVPAGRDIEFLKIDVEGHERQVIEGADWSRHRPKLIICEANAEEQWEPILFDARYTFVMYDGVNRFYVRQEDEALLRPRITSPANASDRFLIHGYLRRINELERSLEQFKQLEQAANEAKPSEPPATQYDDLTPMALRLARDLVKTARRHPRAASIARKIARRLYA